MVTALVLLNIERQHIKLISQQLVDMQEVSEVYSVAGRYDLVAIVRVKNNQQIADTITVRNSYTVIIAQKPLQTQTRRLRKKSTSHDK